MSRRAGQDGYEEVKGNWYHARFRIDVAGQEIRKYKSVPICPVSGRGLWESWNGSASAGRLSRQAAQTPKSTSITFRMSISEPLSEHRLGGGSNICRPAIESR